MMKYLHSFLVFDNALVKEFKSTTSEKSHSILIAHPHEVEWRANANFGKINFNLAADHHEVCVLP
jgi:hypothetical protein